MKKHISIIAMAVVVLLALVSQAEAKNPAPDNTAIYFCQDKYQYNGLHHTKTKDWMNIAACISSIKNEMRRKQQSEQWEFIKANPEYRFPGQSLNKCFAKPRETIVKRVEQTKDGLVVYYKDKTNPCIKR